MAPTHRSGLTKNIKDCEALLETLYRERDARIERQMQPPQVAQQVTKMKRAVSARRYFAKMQDDPAWRERHRSRAREAYHKKQAEAQAQAQAQAEEVSFVVKFGD